MDNYMFRDRLPAPPGPPAPPEEPFPGEGNRKRKRHTVLRSLLALAGGLALCALLVLAAGFFFTLFTLAGSGEDDPAADRPSSAQPSRIEEEEDGWSPADLPWGEPDPDAVLALAPDSGQALTAAQTYQAVLPSIVGITASARQSGYSMGTGIIVTADGYIVTNYHIIEESTDIDVILLSDETSYDAVVIGFDQEKDLAVLKIDAQDLPPASLGDSDALSVGDTVYAVGNPMGYLYGTMTDGIVSALERPQEGGGYDMTLIQTSAALNSGNSGGALVTVSGQVVGITVAKISDTASEVTVEALGLAIPISDALPFLNHILATGSSFRPAIGVLCYQATADGVSGVYVQSVVEGAPADGVLLPGDVILSANGVDTPKPYRLTRVLTDAGVGGTVEMTILRDGEELTVSIVPYDSMEDGE